MSNRFSLTRWCTLSVFSLLVMTSCSENDAELASPISGLFESTVTAGAHDRVVYIPGNSLSIEVISIDDSRCPSDVICFWGGEALVKFSITATGQDIVLYVGSSHPDRPSSATFLFLGQSYELRLSDVTPYPTTKNREVKKKAHFTVHRLGQ